MNTETYEYTINENKLIYSFYSSGKNGTILKLVIYENIALNHFNLAFGDYDRTKNEINDTSRTNNGDTIKVLGTVTETIQMFFKVYKYAILDISGGTSVRTKLYQKIIRDNWAEIETQFNILAFLDGEYNAELVDFSKEYKAFQISKKY